MHTHIHIHTPTSHHILLSREKRKIQNYYTHVSDEVVFFKFIFNYGTINYYLLIIQSYSTAMAATRCMGCLVLRHVPVFRSHGRLAISRGVHQANVVYPFMLGKIYFLCKDIICSKYFILDLSKYSMPTFFHPTYTCRAYHLRKLVFMLYILHNYHLLSTNLYRLVNVHESVHRAI